jgi:hypothetical protein
VDVLERLNRINRTTVFLATLGLGVAGLLLPVPVGPVLIYLVVAALGALLRLTWPVTPPAMRIFRLAVLAGLAVIATVRLLSA